MIGNGLALRTEVIVNVPEDWELEMVPGDDGNSISYYVPRVD